MQDSIETIKSLTATLIADPVDYGLVKSAADELHERLIQLSKLNMEAVVNSEDLVLPSGKAIAPRWAGMCVVDFLRTRKFMKGVYQAVSDLQKPKQEGPIYIVYAGTGPFATLVLPLLHRFSSAEVQFIFLEANTISIESVRKVFQQLDATDYIAELYHCDAANFDLSALGKKADILLVECLQHALLKEPQVAITCNLISQMQDEVQLIPEKIEVSAGLLKMDTRHAASESEEPEIQNGPGHKNVQTIFTLDKEIKKAIKGRYDLNTYEFPVIDVSFSDSEREEFDMLAIQTEIQIYGDQALDFNESGLTIPYLIASLDTDPNVNGLRAQYEVGTAPGFKIKLHRSTT